MTKQKLNGVTRSIHLSTSLHYSSLANFTAAGYGALQLSGQSICELDNGYGLQGNPTCHQLQDAVSGLENGKFSLLYPSGLAALTALGGLLNAGDHWLLPMGAYAPLARYAEYLKTRFGVQYSIYNPLDLQTLQKHITPNTRLIHIESPCSVTFETTNIKQAVAIARKHSIITSADNTWASGVLCQPLKLGVDISVLSLTKYVSGYSDVFMGSITTSSKELFKQLAYHHRVHGYTVSPVSAMLVQRGLESLPVRLAAHSANAKKLVEKIGQHSKVAKIYYAATKSSPALNGSNGLFSVELTRRYTIAELEQPLAALKTLAIGESWGGTKSLVLPFQPQELANRAAPPRGTVLRFHAGLEDIDRQINDVQALFELL